MLEKRSTSIYIFKMYWQVQNGQQMCLLLTKEELGCAAKGTITLVLEVIYNKVSKDPITLPYRFLIHIPGLESALISLIVTGQSWYQNLPTQRDKPDRGKRQVLQKGPLLSFLDRSLPVPLTCVVKQLFDIKTQSNCRSISIRSALK